MAAPSPGLLKTVRMIDRFTDVTGTWIAWLNVPLVAVVAYEVIARYAFHAPTSWSFDLTYMFYGTIFMLLVISGGEAWYAYDIKETSEQTPWRPVLWPYKSVVPLTCLFLLIQGVSELIKSFYAARTGVQLERKEKVEV